MLISLEKLWNPRWIEEQVDGDKWGTYYVDKYPVAGYEQLAGQLVTAQMFYLDAQDCPQKLAIIEGKDGQFATVEAAKAAISMVVRPTIGQQYN